MGILTSVDQRRRCRADTVEAVTSVFLQVFQDRFDVNVRGPAPVKILTHKEVRCIGLGRRVPQYQGARRFHLPRRSQTSPTRSVGIPGNT